jgi:multiple sugar transport system ATP-binding protein
MVIVGPSGCGKSTLLRMIAGLEDISSGDLTIDGKRVNELGPRERDIAMVFQNYALYPHMTVYENMAFGLKLKNYSKSDIKERVMAAAGLLEIADELHRKPKSLSGGQRQRVAIGRAIVRRPKIFLFDEPLSNLDAKLRSQMRIELQKLHREINATMVYVTHDQVEAMTLGNRIAVLQKGRLMQLGAPLSIYNKPGNKFVAGFIGSPEMNFIKGVLAYTGGQYWLQVGTGLAILLGDSVPASLRESVGEAIEIGIRPEHLQVAGIGDGAAVEAGIVAFENMGNEQIIYCSFNQQTIIVKRAAQEEVAIDGVLYLHFLENKIVYFDAGENCR